ncbi:MAG: hypothetical protein ACRDQ2_10450 [Gaiellales bacterium]
MPRQPSSALRLSGGDIDKLKQYLGWAKPGTMMSSGGGPSVEVNE